MSANTTSTKRNATPKPGKDERLNVDTSGLSSQERAELAESLVTPSRRAQKAINKVTPKEQKVGKNAGRNSKNVKSAAKAPRKPAEKRPPGRQSTYNERDANAIIERLSNGEPLREICRDDNMPAWRTVYDWIEANKDFATRFAHARALGEDAISQECLTIADDASNDWMEKFDKDGENIGWQLNHDHVQRSKLRIETRLKLLAKWNPKKWGEKVDLNHGGQPDNPLLALLNHVNGSALPVAKDDE